MGDADFAWTREYGNAVRIKGSFGVESDYVSFGYGHQVEHKATDRERCCSFQTPRSQLHIRFLGYDMLTTHRHCNISLIHLLISFVKFPKAARSLH